MSSHRAALIVLGVALLVPRPGPAQDKPPQPSSASGSNQAVDGGSPEAEIRTLELQLDQEHERLTLATGDCGSACSALASMRRAAERICALEPGPRCTAARSKVDAAASRVRETCAECAIARDEREAPPPAAAPVPESTVASEPGAGGCAGCALRADPRNAGCAALLFAAALAAVRRRRRSSRDAHDRQR